MQTNLYNVLLRCCFSPHAQIVNTEFYERSVSSSSLNLNKEQSCRIESVQKRALKIIYGPGDYSDICAKQGLPSLASRRTEICTSFLITLY